MQRSKKKVLVITGTRAEYGLLRPVLRAMVKSKRLEAQVLVTGMHTLKKFGATIRDIRSDTMPIVAVVPVGDSDTMLQAFSKEVIGIEKYCVRNRPDLILVHGDRDEAFAGAVVAGHLNIPLVHIGGGDTSGYGVDDTLRHAITKFAHVHFPISSASAKRIRELGEEPWRIHMAGPTAFEDMSESAKISKKELAKKLHLRADVPWYLLIQHPTPLDTVPVGKQLQPSLNALARLTGEKIVIYPNSDTGADGFITLIKQATSAKKITSFASLTRDTYLALLAHSELVIGNSSSALVEAGMFGKPVINVGNRQKGREHGENVLHASYNEKDITKAITKATTSAFVARSKKMSHPYKKSSASKKILAVLENLDVNERLLHKQIS